MSTDVAAFYAKFPAYLWVEDAETKSYLDTLWGPSPRLAIRAAAGVASVNALVASARKQFGVATPLVWGLRDRDFLPPKPVAWDGSLGFTFLSAMLTSGQLAREVEVSVRHELENYLLDPPALEIAARALGGNPPPPAGLESLIAKHCSALASWMACRAVLASVNRQQPSFIPDPPVAGVANAAGAHAHIVGHPWWTSLPARPAAAQLLVGLQQEEQAYLAQLQGAASIGDRAASFSGKEVFNDIRQHLKLPNGITKDDLVRAIATAQRKLGTVPVDLAAIATAR